LARVVLIHVLGSLAFPPSGGMSAPPPMCSVHLYAPPSSRLPPRLPPLCYLPHAALPLVVVASVPPLRHSPLTRTSPRLSSLPPCMHARLF
jgi:hypothetical protein